MKFTLQPKTRSGWWSVGLSVAFILLIWTKIQYSLPVPTFAIAGLGLVGFCMAILAIFKDRDRSILNFLPVLVGVVIILWISGELLFPH